MTTLPAQRPHRPHGPRHRWLTAIAVVLLIAIPAGYLVVSAQQSRASGEKKARAASAHTLVYNWPSDVQRRIYDVPVPTGASYVAHYETNSWGHSTLYVQFRASSNQLSTFLERLGTTRSALVAGTVTISPDDTDVTGWDLDDPSRTYAGTIVQQSPDEPEVAVTVDLTHKDQPRVYVVSASDL